MGLMFLVNYGKHIGDKKYCFSEAVRQLTIVFERCEKDGSGLLYHAYCEGSKAAWAHKITGKAPEIWCEGLGWYALMLAEALALIPKDFPGYGKLAAQYQKLHSGLACVQDKSSGLWYQVVDKPRHPRNWHDTSGSAMFAYSMCKGVKLGLLDAAVYEPCARKSFEGLKTKCVIGPDGRADIYDACDGLGVQTQYDLYVDYARNVNSKECVAAYLWAAAAFEYEAL